MTLYTKTGDDGTTGLFGGERVGKDDLRVACYGAVDEANAALGMAAAQLPDGDLRELILRLQSELFTLGADLATPGTDDRVPRMRTGDALALEATIDAHSDALPPLRHFILPGGTPAAAALHLARATVRRAERDLVALRRTAADTTNPDALIYLNRLSDLLFVLARSANAAAGVADIPWKTR